MRKHHLSIIIPVFNLWDMTSSCLESLQECTSGKFYEVLVVDNGSTDSTPKECRKFGESLFGGRFNYIRLEKNINFGPACNLGASRSEGELLFFLNNDTLLSTDWFGPLLETFKNNPAMVAASPLCLFPDSRRIQNLGIGFTGSLGVRHPYFMFPGDHPVVRRERKFQALGAAALMISAGTFKQLDGFFPEYANGFEDIDLCCRLRRAGGRLVQQNKAVLYHWGSKTPGRNRHDSQNIGLINKRCAGCFKPDLHRIAIEDGFRCELTPWLEMIMHDPGLPKNGSLDSLTGEDELIDALDKYPLWENGYEMLSAFYRDQGRFEEAVEILNRGLIHFPDPDRFMRLANLAREAGRPEIADFSMGKAAGIQNSLNSKNNLRKKAESVLKWAKANKDRELEGIYERWIR